EDVFSAQPTCKTQATSSSPAGLYEITVDGAEAENYSFTYVAGHLSISTPTGILTIKSDGKAPGDIYTLLGVKVRCKHESIDGLPTGVYVTNGRKILIKN
ncbi:MAG: peptidase C10 family protein, partial [Paludibacteraceae bacterium]|nr:peptidase C10 family protein [Paludibacteraceae bacterium]